MITLYPNIEKQKLKVDLQGAVLAVETWKTLWHVLTAGYTEFAWITSKHVQ